MLHIPENYRPEKLTIDLVKANGYALLILVPIILLYGLPYYLLWHQENALPEFVLSLKRTGVGGAFGNIGGMFLIMLLGVVLHELIHGITWAVFAEKGFRSIRFGVLWKALAPYCHCQEPLKVKHYVLGALMPAVLLGFIPAVYAILTNNLPLLVFGGFFTMAAIGDFMIIFLLRNEDPEALVLDHPSEAGCFIYRKPDPAR